MSKSVLLRSFTVEPDRATGRATALLFMQAGKVSVKLTSALTFLVGENGCGKTTLLEALAARCGMRPGGGGSYAETDDERPETPLLPALGIEYAGLRPPQGVFLRADRLAEAAARAPRMRMATTGEWRRADEQSRGEGVLSLLSAQIDESERKLYILDEPETGLSPQRQMALLCLLDNIHRDGRSQAIVATHSPILLSHPGADILWVDEAGITRKPLADVEHWRVMRRFMADPESSLRRLLAD